MAGFPGRSLLTAQLRGDLGARSPAVAGRSSSTNCGSFSTPTDVPPGTAIPVDEVAELCGVSRIPVRE